MFPVDDDEPINKAQIAKEALALSAKIAETIYKQLKEQGANNAVLHLAAIDLSIMALTRGEIPASEFVRVGAIKFYAHRVLGTDVPFEPSHDQDGCKVCAVISNLETDL